jgi:hypothetical protein
LRIPAWLGWRRRLRGLEAVPERYRLQFLLLASSRLPGGSPEDVAGLAGRLAARVRIPAALLKLENPDRLDAWFRDHRDGIVSLLDEVAA